MTVHSQVLTWLEIKVIAPIENVEKNEVQWKRHSAHRINSDSQIWFSSWLAGHDGLLFAVGLARRICPGLKFEHWPSMILFLVCWVVAVGGSRSIRTQNFNLKTQDWFNPDFMIGGHVEIVLVSSQEKCSKKQREKITQFEKPLWEQRKVFVPKIKNNLDGQLLDPTMLCY